MLVDGENGGRTAHGAERRGIVHALLRFPLFYKILIANAAVVVLLGLACVSLGHVPGAPEARNVVLLLGAGLLVTVATNAAILTLALIPLKRLEDTAEQVQSGNLSARAELSSLADRELERLTITFNAMLDAGEAYRRRLRDVAARALSAQEEERKRIARELHDGTAQTLAALRVRLRVARATEDPLVREDLLERISGELGEATEEIRHIAQGLRPPALDMLGLAPAVESYARSLSETSGVEIRTEMPAIDRLLSPEAELALYRIVQEALTNVARHSGAKHARVVLTTTPRQIVVSVEDDGRGFRVEDAARTGLGLFGMQERGAYVGGTVDIESEPGRGTRVRAVVPVVETARYA